MSGRSCSEARRLFFERHAFMLEKMPKRIITHHQAAVGQLLEQSPQREIRLLGDPLRMGAKKLIQKKTFKLVAIALANRMARIAFGILRGKTVYREIPA